MMWYFTISCTAGFLACLGSCDRTNTYMYAGSEKVCFDKASALAAMERLPKEKWTIRCEQAAVAGQ